MAKGLLVSYSGYPYTPSSLMPDNGLANLAGSLISNGHDVRIVDFNTLATIDRLIPEECRGQLSGVYDRFSSDQTLDNVELQETAEKLLKIDQVVRETGEVVVGSIEEELLEAVRRERVDFVGFKLWFGNGFDDAIRIAETLKRRYPRLKVYAGGPCIDQVRSCIFSITDAFDAVSVGEGEETILGLAKYSEGKGHLSDTPNLQYRDGTDTRETERKSVHDLDELPSAVYDENIYPSLKGNQKIRVFVLDESRGCPNQCSFCTYTEKHSRRTRTKSPARIVSEIKRLKELHGSAAFRYGGGCPPLNLMEAVARLLIDQGINVGYSSFGHARDVEPESLGTLKRSGLQVLNFGIESGDDRILKEVMLKGNRAEQIELALVSSMNAGIYTIGSIIAPTPRETAESRENTVRLLVRVFQDNPNGNVQVFPPGLFPCSAWGREPEKYGFMVEPGLSYPEGYIRRTASYQIKRFFPPEYWEPLPYSLDDMTSATMFGKTKEMYDELRRSGVSIVASDEDVLMSRIIGEPLSRYMLNMRRAFYSGDVETIGEYIDRVNANVGEPNG